MLRSDPNIRNFMEKLIELEKAIKITVQSLEEWAAFQRNYVYLYGIFHLAEMREQMPAAAASKCRAATYLLMVANSGFLFGLKLEFQAVIKSASVASPRRLRQQSFGS